MDVPHYHTLLGPVSHIWEILRDSTPGVYQIRRTIKVSPLPAELLLETQFYHVGLASLHLINAGILSVSHPLVASFYFLRYF